MKWLALGAFLALGSTSALAHEKWWDGKEVDPVTKRYCCGDNDIKHLEPSEVHVRPDGYKLDDSGETVPYAQAQPSPDGEYWVFRWGNPVRTQCFFAPVGAS
jgi:hypothetical protein